jgi:hypothetical protein
MHPRKSLILYRPLIGERIWCMHLQYFLVADFVAVKFYNKSPKSRMKRKMKGE